MGSHGGGTAEGQRQVLVDLGFDPVTTGIEIRSTLDTELLGTTPVGVPVHLDRAAVEADFIYPVGRVKPHTSFDGDLQSGLVKLTVVGGGKVHGARSFHRAVLREAHSRVLEAMFEVVRHRVRLLGGLAIVEDARHDTALLEHLPPETLVDRERELLGDAVAMMPSLPVDELDVLVVDEIGKNISGAGMDPNVTGRRFRINARWQAESPRITRIVALRISEASHGNAAGIGLADFVTRRLVADMDEQATYLNAITSMNTVHAHIPIRCTSDRLALVSALRSVGRTDAEFGDVRLLRIRNTLDLATMWASEALVGELAARPGVAVTPGAHPFRFDDAGDLVDLAL
jgi:hypothetical protein